MHMHPANALPPHGNTVQIIPSGYAFGKCARACISLSACPGAPPAAPGPYQDPGTGALGAYSEKTLHHAKAPSPPPQWAHEGAARSVFLATQNWGDKFRRLARAGYWVQHVKAGG